MAIADHRRQVFTPEVVVNGRSDVVGTERDELDALVCQDDRGEGAPTVTIAGDLVTVSGPGTSPGAVVPAGSIQPEHPAGTNPAWRKWWPDIAHRNVVRQLISLGDWNGRDRSLQPRAPEMAVASKHM